MANIKYEVTRWDVSCNHNSTDVCSVILGITATHNSGLSAYKDERISVPCQNLTEFEAGAEAFVEGVLGSQGWYLELQTRIADQMTAPEPAPPREMPDFASMTIGDGYTELPSEEEAEEEEEATEEEAEEEAEEEETDEEEAEGSGE
jgi:hypothetical protein